MWRFVLNAAKQLFTLNRSIERHDREIEELREEMKAWSLALEKVKHELKNLRESERHEREKYAFASLNCDDAIHDAKCL